MLLKPFRNQKQL